MPKSKSTRARFDARAKSYENGRLGGWRRAQSELVLARARLQTGAAVLDVGCATGWLLRRMAHRYTGIAGLGVDLSPRMIELARERTRVEAVGDLTFVAGDWMKLDPRLLLQANGLAAADLVCCVDTLHYFSDPATALEKMFQVTGAGGRLLLLDRARDRSLATFVWDLVHRGILRDTARYYRSEELVSLVAGAGFADARVAASVRRLLWKGKLATSLALVSARRP